MATYYMRADGRAANKNEASGPVSDASKCMSIATHNSETFEPGDTIYISGRGGDYDCSSINMKLPSSGTKENHIIYKTFIHERPTFDGHNLNDHCWYHNHQNHITVNGLVFQNAIKRMMLLRAFQASMYDYIIENCSFTSDTNAVGIHLYCENYDLSNVTIINCNFYRLNQDGIRFYFGLKEGTGTIYNVTIINCNFNSIMNSDTSVSGINMHFSDIKNALQADRLPYGISIEDNTFNKISSSAIRYYSKSTPKNFIRGNNISYSGYSGYFHTNALQLHGCKDLIVEDNNISYTEANTHPGDGDAIILDWADRDKRYICEDVIVRRNRCHNNSPQPESDGAGINIYRAKNCQIYNNTLKNNLETFRISKESSDNIYYHNTIINEENLKLVIDIEPEN